MRRLITTLGMLALLVAFAAAASAQQKPADKPAVPRQFAEILESYRGWKPQDEKDFDANSLDNWATHGLRVRGRLLLGAARNWLSTRSEARFKELAAAYKSELRGVFELLFVGRGMQVVFATPYSADIHDIYGSWYDCISRTKGGRGEPVGDDRVLAQLWFEDGTKKGSDNECADDLRSLSRMYGVGELSKDDLYAIGFLSRRHAANVNNPRLISAETVRQVVHEIFDED